MVQRCSRGTSGRVAGRWRASGASRPAGPPVGALHLSPWSTAFGPAGSLPAPFPGTRRARSGRPCDRRRRCGRRSSGPVGWVRFRLGRGSCFPLWRRFSPLGGGIRSRARIGLSCLTCQGTGLVVGSNFCLRSRRGACLSQLHRSRRLGFGRGLRRAFRNRPTCWDDDTATWSRGCCMPPHYRICAHRKLQTSVCSC